MKKKVTLVALVLVVLSIAGVFIYIRSQTKEPNAKSYGTINKSVPSETTKESHIEDLEKGVTEASSTPKEAENMIAKTKVGDLKIKVEQTQILDVIPRQNGEYSNGNKFFVVTSKMKLNDEIPSLDVLKWVLEVDGQEIEASKEATVSANQFPLVNIPKNFEFSYSVAFESKEDVFTNAQSIKLKVFSSDGSKTQTMDLK